MMNFPKDKVNKNELEIVIFGKGYGESILLHLFNEKYILIDSFINPETSNPIALDYLDSIGLNANNIVGIVCTHWHDDHTRGISQIIESSTNKIDVYIPLPLNSKEVFEFIKFYSDTDEPTTSEFSNLLDFRQKNKINLLFASEDKNLFHKEMVKLNNQTTKIISLTPNSEQQHIFLQSILLPKNGDFKNQSPLQNNDISVVVYANMIVDQLLFGADMENSIIGGWDYITEHYSDFEKSHIFKIPHHGSITAHNNKIWQNLVEKPISIVTRFNSKHLPRQEMIDLIKNESSALYVIGGESKKDKTLKSILRNTTSYFDSKFEIVDSQIGLIRLVKSPENYEWKITPMGKYKVYYPN